MSDYIKNNSKRCVNQFKCTKQRFQSYSALTFGETLTYKTPISCRISEGCIKSDYNYQKYVLHQQNLYAKMRRQPELFPIISSAKQIGLSIGQQRAYSNLWYRQFGTSQALPVNDNWGGFYVVGSEVPFTD